MDVILVCITAAEWFVGCPDGIHWVGRCYCGRSAH